MARQHFNKRSDYNGQKAGELNTRLVGHKGVVKSVKSVSWSFIPMQWMTPNTPIRGLVLLLTYDSNAKKHLKQQINSFLDYFFITAKA